MKEVYSAITRYRFGAKFRSLVLCSMLILICFHIFVLVAPFLKSVKMKIQFSDKRIEHFRTISNSVSNITIAVILMFIVIEGSRSLRAMLVKQRRENYAEVERQILDWFKETRPKTFDFEANVVTSEPAKSKEILGNFKAEGSPRKIMEIYGNRREGADAVSEYCRNVHFELTCYPNEIIYGIHIEFNDYSLSKMIYDRLENDLQLSRQSKEFKIDDIIPKKPG